MLSTRAVSQALWKYVSATSVLAVGPARIPTAGIFLTPKVILPSGGKAEGKSSSRWCAVSSSASIVREYRTKPTFFLNKAHHFSVPGTIIYLDSCLEIRLPCMLHVLSLSLIHTQIQLQY